jgi:hypothetical protein
MQISQLISRLQAIQTNQGDIDVMMVEDGRFTRAIEELDIIVAEEGDFPKSWNMPAGFTFVQLGTGN